MQASRHQSLDDVAEYFGGLDSEPARPGEGGAAVFKPGWEDIFRMNQKQLEVAVRRMWNDPGAIPFPSFSLSLYILYVAKHAVRRMWNNPGALSCPSFLLQTLYHLYVTKHVVGPNDNSQTKVKQVVSVSNSPANVVGRTLTGSAPLSASVIQVARVHVSAYQWQLPVVANTASPAWQYPT